MSGGGITAAGLLVLLLALIGLGVGLYYAYICLRARPVRPRQHTDCEEGPLIVVDPDVNGNHEDVPVEASAPVDEELDPKKKVIPDEHHIVDKGKSAPIESNGPVEGAPNGPTKEKEEILVPIEKKPEPTKLIHENEVNPEVNHVAPLGFVAPIIQVPHDTVPVSNQSPKKIESAKQEKTEPEKVHHPVNSPVPIFVPVVVKKPVTDSDEEDGLLLQKCAPHDDSLDPESQPVVAVSNILKDDAESCNKPPHSGTESIPDKHEINEPVKELENIPCLIAPEPTQPVIEVKAPEPIITVPITPEYGWKKEDAPIVESTDDSPSEVAEDEHLPLLMKEEVENLQPVEKAPDAKGAAQDLLDENSKLLCDNQERVEENEPVKEVEVLPSAVSDTDIQETEEKNPEKIRKSSEVPEYPEVVYLETSNPFPNKREEENIKSSDDDDSSEAEPSVPTIHDDVECPEELAKECDLEGTLKETDLKSSELPSNSEPQKASNILDITPVEVNSETSIEVPSDAPLEDNGDSPIALDVTVKAVNEQKKESEHQVTDAEPVINISVPEKATIVPLQSLNSDHELPVDIPLEAEGSYYSDTEDEGSTLAVIKEEGSADAESEGNDTDTSEPEVTQYSFSSDPSGPSTTNILADEISITLDPEVTKYSVISELEATSVSSDSDSQSSDEESEVDLASVSNIEETTANSDVELEVTIPVDPCVATVDEANKRLTESSDATDLLPPETVDSSTESSEIDSEGEEAESEVKEELVPVPVAPEIQPVVVSTVESAEDKTPVECEADKVKPDTEQISQATNVKVPEPAGTSSSNNSSSSSSISSDSDISDDEVAPATKMSKIPRLVEHHGS